MLRLYNTQHRTPIHNTIRSPQCAHCRPPPAVVVARVLQVVPFSVSACRPPACRVFAFAVGALARPPSAAHLRAVLLLPLAPVPPLPNSTPCCASQHTAPDPYSPHNPMSALLPTCVPACRCGDACVAVCAPAPPPRAAHLPAVVLLPALPLAHVRLPCLSQLHAGPLQHTTRDPDSHHNLLTPNVRTSGRRRLPLVLAFWWSEAERMVETLRKWYVLQPPYDIALCC